MKRKTCLAFTKQVFWQREKDSNPHKQSQSLSCYPYTIPLYVPAIAGTSDIIARYRNLSRENRKKIANFSGNQLKHNMTALPYPTAGKIGVFQRDPLVPEVGNAPLPTPCLDPLQLNVRVHRAENTQVIKIA